MLIVDNSPGKGRGVFAARDIEAGEIIERSPVIVIPEKQKPDLRKTILNVYVFRWGEKKKDRAVVLGLGTLINHSYNPNAFYRAVLEEMCMEFIALKDIREGEEITITYARVWFDVHE